MSAAVAAISNLIVNIKDEVELTLFYEVILKDYCLNVLVGLSRCYTTSVCSNNTIRDIDLISLVDDIAKILLFVLAMLYLY